MYEDYGHAKDEQHERRAEELSRVRTGTDSREENVHEQHAEFELAFEAVHEFWQKISHNQSDQRDEQDVVIRHFKCVTQHLRGSADDEAKRDCAGDVGQQQPRRVRVHQITFFLLVQFIEEIRRHFADYPANRRNGNQQHQSNHADDTACADGHGELGLCHLDGLRHRKKVDRTADIAACINAGDLRADLAKIEYVETQDRPDNRSDARYQKGHHHHATFTKNAPQVCFEQQQRNGQWNE